MKLIATSLLTLFTMLIAVPSFAQDEPAFLWVRHLGPPINASGNIGNDVAIDSRGGTIVTGSYHGFAIADITNGDSTVLTPEGGGDAFVERVHSDGTLDWVATGASQADEYASSLALDAADNIYVAGNVTAVVNQNNSITFGNGVSLPVAEAPFLVRYDSSGKADWAVMLDIQGTSRINDITVSDDGAIYVVGDFKGSAIIADDTLASIDRQSVFLARFDTAGNAVWGRMGTCTQTATGRTIAVRGGLLYAGGGFGSLVGQTPAVLRFDTLTESGAGAWLGRFDTDGNAHWITSTTGDRSATINALALSPSGEPIVVGSFGDPSAIGTSTHLMFDKDTLTGVGASDMFVAAYDAVGFAFWANSVGGIGADAGNGVAVGPNGDIWVAGEALGTIRIGDRTITGRGDGDALVVRYDKDGTPLWATATGGSQRQGDAANAIATDSAGGVISITGIFRQEARFGRYAIHAHSGGAEGEVFVASLGATAGPESRYWRSDNAGLIVDDDANGVAHINAVGIDDGWYYAGGISGVFRRRTYDEAWNRSDTVGNVRAVAANGEMILAGGSGVRISTDRGATWTDANAGFPGHSVSVFDLTFDGSRPVAATVAGVFRLESDTWQPLNNGLGNSAIGAVGVVGSTYLAADYAMGGLFRSTDAGASWTRVTAVPNDVNSNPAVIDGFVAHNGAIYAATGRVGSTDGAVGVLQSTDDGATWTVSGSGLPDVFDGNSIAVNSLSSNGSELFAGTPMGLYISSDNGGSWSPWEYDLPQCEIRSVAANGRDVLAATVCSGIWYLYTNTIAVPTADSGTSAPMVSRAFPNPAAGGRTTVSYAVPEDGLVTIRLVDQLGRILQTVVADTYQRQGNYLVDISLEGLTPQTYLVSVTVNGRTQATTVLVP